VRIAPPHSIASPATEAVADGNSTPGALAVLRLRTNANLVDARADIG
jgi:hypothetical protein